MSLLRRVLPAPWLAAGLFALWLALARSASPGNVFIALVIALGLPRIVAPLTPQHARLRGIGRILRFLGRVAFDVVHSNLVIARDVLAPWRRPRPAFVVVPLELRDPAGLAALAWVTTIVPGTVWSELASDRHALLLHVWDAPDEAAFVRRYKERYERPLREIFE